MADSWHFPPGGKEAELLDMHCMFSSISLAVDLPVLDCTRPSVL